jgi:uncharacterized protein YnzC (UPF0291/DUF896 family)
MFGYKDSREDKSHISQLISVGAFLPFGIGMMRWVNSYGYKTRKLFGVGVSYPTNVRQAANDVFQVTSSMFTRDPGSRLSSQDFDRYFPMVNHLPNEIDEIERVRVLIEKYEKEVTSIQNNIRDTIDKISSNIEYRVKKFKEMGLTEKEYVEQNKYRVEVFTQFKERLESYKKMDVVEAIQDRVRKKYPIANFTQLNFQNLNVLDEFKDALLEGIGDTRNTLNTLKLTTREVEVFDTNVVNKFKSIEDNLIFAYRTDIYTRPIEQLTTLEGTSVDVASLLKNFPVLDGSMKMDGRYFLERLCGDKYDFVKSALDTSGIPSSADTALRDVQRLKNLLPEEFGGQIHRLFKGFEKFVKSGKISDVQISYRNVFNAKEIMFKVLTKGPKAGGNIGEFTFSLLVPHEGRLGSGIPYLTENVIANQVKAITDNIDSIVNGSLLMERREVNQKYINMLQRKALRMIPETTSPIESLKLASTSAGNIISYTNMAGLTEKKLKDAFMEIHKFKGSRIVHFIDVGFGDIKRGQETESIVKDIAIITQELRDDGSINIRSAWHVKAREYEKVNTLFSADFARNVGFENLEETMKFLNIKDFGSMTEEDLVRLLNHTVGTNGTIVGKALRLNTANVKGDIYRLKQLANKYKGKGVSDLLYALDNRIVDMQPMMSLQLTEFPPDLTPAGKGIESMATRINNLLGWLKKNDDKTYHQALNYVNSVERRIFNLKGPLTPRLRRKLIAAHRSKYDVTYTGLYTTLLSNFRYKDINSFKDFMDYIKSPIPGFEDKQLMSRISSSQAFAGKVNELRPEQIFPFVELGSPYTNKMYQAYSSVRTDYKLSKPLPIVTSGGYQSSTFVPVISAWDPEVSEGGVWANKKFIKSQHIYEHRQVFLVDEFQNMVDGMNNGHVIKATPDGTPHCIGYSDGKRVFLSGTSDVEIVDKPIERDPFTGKRVLIVEEKVPIHYGQKIGFSATGAGLGLTDMLEDNLRWGFSYSPDAFKRNDYVAVINNLLGKIDAFVATRPDAISKVVESVNKHLTFEGKPIVTPKQVGRYLVLERNLGVINPENINENTIRHFQNKLFTVLKEIGSTQARFIGNYDYMRRLAKKSGKYKGNVEWYDQTVRAVKAAKTGSLMSFFKDMSDTGILTLQEWLRTGNYSDEERKMFIDAITKGDTEIVNRLWDNHDLVNLLDVDFYGPGKPRFHATINFSESAWFSSTLPSWATRSGMVKLSNRHMALLKNHPGAQKGYFEDVVRVLNEQSANVVGKGSYILNIATQKEFQPHGFNIGAYIDELEKRVDSDAEKIAWKKFTLGQSPELSQFYGDNVIEYQGRYYTDEQFRSKFPGIDPESLPETSRVDISRRIRSRENVEFLDILNKKGEGYFNLKGKAVFVNVSGKYRPQFNNLQYFKSDYAVHPLENVKHERGKFVVISEEAMTLQNIALNRNDPSMLPGHIQQRWDVLMNRVMKESHVAYVPGVKSHVMFGEEYVLDQFGSPMVEYTKSTTLRQELLINKSYMKQHPDAFSKSLDAMSADDLHFVEQYHRNYKSVLGGVIGEHPSMKAASMADARKAFETSAGVTLDKFFDMLKNTPNGLSQDPELRKLYSTAVDYGLVGLKGFMEKQPIATTDSVAGSYVLARNVKMPRSKSGVQVIGLVSRVAGMKIHIDQDGDWIDTVMTAEGWRGMMEYSGRKTVSETDALQYLGTHLLEHGELPGSISKDEASVLFFNNRMNAVTALPISSAMPVIGKQARQNLSFIFDKDAAKEAFERSRMIKEGAPRTSRIIFAASDMLRQLGKDIPIEAQRSLFDTLGSLAEWGLSQKRAREFHNVVLLDDMFSNIHVPGGVIDFERKILEAKSGKVNGLIGKEIENLLIDAPREYHGFIESNDLKNPLSNLALISSVARKFPGYVKYGSPDYIINHGMHGYMGDLYKRNIAGQMMEDYPTAFQIGGPFRTPEEDFGKNFKRAVRNVGGQKAVETFMTGGKMLAAAGAAYLLLNIFKPDQSAYLGHMPGKGGEYYDWNFTKPEMDWAQLMHTPFEDTFGPAPVHLRLYNPAYMDNGFRRRRRDQLPYPEVRRLQAAPIDRNVVEF